MVNTKNWTVWAWKLPRQDDLTKEEYKDSHAVQPQHGQHGTKLLINTMVWDEGHDEAMEYFKALDKNISQYTKSGSGPSKMKNSGECVIESVSFMTAFTRFFRAMRQSS